MPARPSYSTSLDLPKRQKIRPFPTPENSGGDNWHSQLLRRALHWQHIAHR